MYFSYSQSWLDGHIAFFHVSLFFDQEKTLLWKGGLFILIFTRCNPLFDSSVTFSTSVRTVRRWWRRGFTGNEKEKSSSPSFCSHFQGYVFSCYCSRCRCFIVSFTSWWRKTSDAIQIELNEKTNFFSSNFLSHVIFLFPVDPFPVMSFFFPFVFFSKKKNLSHSRGRTWRETQTQWWWQRIASSFVFLFRKTKGRRTSLFRKNKKNTSFSSCIPSQVCFVDQSLRKWQERDLHDSHSWWGRPDEESRYTRAVSWKRSNQLTPSIGEWNYWPWRNHHRRVSHSFFFKSIYEFFILLWICLSLSFPVTSLFIAKVILLDCGTSSQESLYLTLF